MGHSREKKLNIQNGNFFFQYAFSLSYFPLILGLNNFSFFLA